MSYYKVSTYSTSTLKMSLSQTTCFRIPVLSLVLHILCKQNAQSYCRFIFLAVHVTIQYRDLTTPCQTQYYISICKSDTCPTPIPTLVLLITKQGSRLPQFHVSFRYARLFASSSVKTVITLSFYVTLQTRHSDK